MHLCYVDEAGNDQVLDVRDAPPVLAIAGITIADSRLKDFVWEYMAIKKRFNPQLERVKLSELIRTEVKGANLRADIRSGSHRRKRRAIGFLDQVMKLLEETNATLVGQIWVKANGAGISSGFYPDAIAGMAADVQAQLAAASSRGLMIIDAQTHWKTVPSVNGITTRRFRSGGDALDCMMESPVFGHSDAHIALQVADIVASALLFPMACAAFCADVTDNAHPHPAYAELQERYGSRLRDLEHRYVDAQGFKNGGIRVRNKRDFAPAHQLYSASPVQATVTPLRPDRRDRTRTRRGAAGTSQPEGAAPTA